MRWNCWCYLWDETTMSTLSWWPTGASSLAVCMVDRQTDWLTGHHSLLLSTVLPRRATHSKFQHMSSLPMTRFSQVCRPILSQSRGCRAITNPSSQMWSSLPLYSLASSLYCCYITNFDLEHAAYKMHCCRAGMIQFHQYFRRLEKQNGLGLYIHLYFTKEMVVVNTHTT